MILDYVFFFRITGLTVGNRLNYLWLFLIIVIGICVNGYGYKGDLFFDFIEIFIFYLMYKKLTDRYLILGSFTIIFNVDIILDIIRTILLGIIIDSTSKNMMLNLNFLLAILSCLIIIFIIKKYSYKIKLQLSGDNKQIFLWLSCYLFLVNIIICLVYTETKHVPSVTVFFITFLIIQAIFALGIYRLIQKEQRQLIKKKDQEKLKQNQRHLEEYATYLEKSEDDLRAFRHDYRNILNSLKISAQEGDVQEVIQKLDKYTETNLNSEALLKYKDVNHLYVKSIKSIIIAKLTEIYNLKIPYNFECRNKIRKLPDHIDELDLVRIIGITFDNAIEESKALLAKDKKAEIQSMIYLDNLGEFEYEIRNKVQDKNISTNQIQERGFTTKKDHNGLGLANIKEIENKYPDMSISYMVQDGWFDFYMVIETEDGEEDD
ncbi:GHKL domain-containing protein [Lactobacillus ultunensis]|uniref:Sensor histidine kinase NatK-like C-terminal domain-containing protein n=1 Tax=Lactobacillus ultunensis DSM 16047 TaxID=525365 RepID=C2EPF2_9LACO|nr:hypothetical protein HMPREF0548_1548 [Lactobacillus ultunensis DSM 16047]